MAELLEPYLPETHWATYSGGSANSTSLETKPPKAWAKNNATNIAKTPMAIIIFLRLKLELQSASS